MYERPGEVLAVHGRQVTPPGAYRFLSYPDYADLRERSATFSALAAYNNVLAAVTDNEVTRRAMAGVVSANYFDLFGRPPTPGRAFSPEEERPGAAFRVAVVSHDYWLRLGGGPDAIGRTIRINGHPFTVVGVAPEDFTGLMILGPDLWVPLGDYDALGTPNANTLSERTAYELAVVGRLAPGVSGRAAKAELATQARQLAEAFPDADGDFTLETSTPSRLSFSPRPDGNAEAAQLATFLTIMALVVLLVACLNLSNMLVARGHARRQEIAVRLSLGGGRGRLVRQLVTEGLVLALAGGAIGLLVASWATDALFVTMGPVLQQFASANLIVPTTDWRVMTGTFGFCVLAALLFGLWPAWSLTRPAALDGLGQQAREDRGATPGRLRGASALVVGQVALSLGLLATGGLFLVGARSAASADPGFSLDGGLVVDVEPHLAGYDAVRGRETYGALLDRLRALPGVVAASAASQVPFGPSQDSAPVIPAGSADPQAQMVFPRRSVIGRDHFRALGLPVVRGRDFTSAEMTIGDAARVAIVDDALAERFWPGEDPLGRQLQFVTGPSLQLGEPLEVVGVVPTVRYRLSDTEAGLHVYLPLGQDYDGAMSLHARLAGGSEESARAMLGTVAGIVREVAPDVPVLGVRTWRELRDGSSEIWVYRAGGMVFSTFAAFALLLTVIGVYGVKAYLVARRTREFGIRVAVGAGSRDVLWLVLREGSRTTALGIGIGLLLALGVSRLLQSFLYGVGGFEPVVLLTAPLVLIGAALLASYFPARRATRVDPVVALRQE